MPRQPRAAKEPRSFAAHGAGGVEDPQVDGASLRDEHKTSRGLRFGGLKDGKLSDWSVRDR